MMKLVSYKWDFGRKYWFLFKKNLDYSSMIKAILSKNNSSKYP